MDAERIDHLLQRYASGEASESEVKQLEKLIEQGKIALDELPGFEKLNNLLMQMEAPAPSEKLDHQFRAMLRKENEALQAKASTSWFNLNDLLPRLTFASIALIIGLAAGYVFWSPGLKNDQIVQLGTEITALREMMMLSMLEKESATDRLKAVNLTQEMGDVSAKVTAALLQTLNNDENVNVRLAALDALRPYSRDSQIREALIHSIALQKSPLVQVALAELMVQLQEKGAIDELKKIMEDKETPSDIRQKIQESIQVI
jgi:hypothetical protein